MGDPNKQVMQLLQAYMLSSLVLVAWIDHYIPADSGYNICSWIS